MIGGTGIKEMIVVYQRKAGKPNKRGTGFESSVENSMRVNAVVTKRMVTRDDNETGGQRQSATFEFYLPPNTIDVPLLLGTNPLRVEYRGHSMTVTNITDWPQHQILQADIPQIV